MGQTSLLPVEPVETEHSLAAQAAGVSTQAVRAVAEVVSLLRPPVFHSPAKREAMALMALLLAGRSLYRTALVRMVLLRLAVVAAVAVALRVRRTPSGRSVVATEGSMAQAVAELVAVPMVPPEVVVAMGRLESFWW